MLGVKPGSWTENSWSAVLLDNVPFLETRRIVDANDGRSRDENYRGERFGEQHAGPARRRRRATRIGSKPAKGKKPTSAVGRIAGHAPGPDGGPKLRLRRRANGMFAWPRGEIRALRTIGAIAAKRRARAFAPPENQEPAASFGDSIGQVTSARDARVAEHRLERRRRCMTRGGRWDWIGITSSNAQPGCAKDSRLIPIHFRLAKNRRDAQARKRLWTSKRNSSSHGGASNAAWPASAEGNRSSREAIV